LTEFALCRESLTNYAARNATKSKGTASLKLDSDPLGSQFLNDSAEAVGDSVIALAGRTRSGRL